MPHLTAFLRGLSVLVLFHLFATTSTPLSAQDRGAQWFQHTQVEESVSQDSLFTGRLWGVERPPLKEWNTRYGIEAGEEWIEHLSQGVLRLPNCSAALASADGLALTTARCLRKHVAEADVADTEERVFEDEPTIPGLYADQLVETQDVTEQVQSEAGTTAVGPSDLQSVREQVQNQRDQEGPVEIVAEAGGTRYTAYLYRRYEDLRLVFLPGTEVSEFGGLAEAHAYPRHSLDVALFRVYTEDAPLDTEQHFEVRSQGVRPGDPVFGIGHPSKAHRAESRAQISFRRDVLLPHQQSSIDRWITLTKTYLDTADSRGWYGERRLRHAQRRQKALRLQREALQKDALKQRLQRREESLRHAVQEVGGEHEGILDSLSALQQAKRQYTSAYRAFGALETSPYTSATLRRALLVSRIQQTTGAEQNRLLQQLEDVPPQPPAVDAGLLAEHLEAFRTHLKGDSVTIGNLLDGEAPDARARSIVEASALAKAGVAQQNQASALPTEDPALSLVSAVRPAYEEFREEWERLRREEEHLTDRLTRVRRQVQDHPVLLPARRAPRITDGRVEGFPYNGTWAAPFTTYYGLFAQHSAFGGREDWRLPETWTSAQRLDRSQVLNIASSTDRASGMQGAPLLNQYLELVGVTFDGNAASAGDPYLFLPSHMRGVSVDLRGLREALMIVYEADSLLEELFGYRSPRRERSP